jgi:hypothetical protein
MSANLPGYLNTSEDRNKWPGSGHSFVNPLCPVCNHARQSKVHKDQRNKCSREMQRRMK